MHRERIVGTSLLQYLLHVLILSACKKYFDRPLGNSNGNLDEYLVHSLVNLNAPSAFPQAS